LIAGHKAVDLPLWIGTVRSQVSERQLKYFDNQAKAKTAKARD
jgi:hypothetical protein